MVEFYFSKIPNYMTEKQVKEMFADYGKVKDIKFCEEKGLRGLYVEAEYASEEEVIKAIEALNNKEFPGKPPKKWKFYWEPG